MKDKKLWSMQWLWKKPFFRHNISMTNSLGIISLGGLIA
uniref:Uncharacterized protein n=1 Tax=Lepeophtheirus salmonis TaxID=72036 RepID=A0A0K2TTB4_LEPSM